jgi:uncharacterized protein YukE
MKKLSKQDSARLDHLSEKMEAVKSRIESVINNANSELESLMAEFNGHREEAVGIFEDAVSQMEDFFDNRSEKWQEGDTGTEYRNWIEGWERYKEMLENEPSMEIELNTDDLDNCVEACNDVERDFNP